MKTKIHTTRTSVLSIATGTLLLFSALGTAGAAPFAAIDAGKAEYLRYCANCHGADGKGFGPDAKTMEQDRSADLTAIASNNFGVYPFTRVFNIIEGLGDLTGHGGWEMPAWGLTFRDQGDYTQAQGRIMNLTLYLASMQSDAVLNGRREYLRSCATCHGVDADGAGPLADIMENGATDLTRFALDNKGFDHVAMFDVIASRANIDGHGSWEMPVWGTVFREDGNPTASDIRVLNLTLYLQSIQVK